MTTIKLTRTGREPLQFDGSLIGRATSITGEKRSHTLAVYQTKGGKLVASIEYNSSWSREHNTGHADHFGTWQDVVAFFGAYNAAADVTGFPPGDQFSAKEAAEKRAVFDAYDDALSRLCEALGWAEILE